MNKLSQFSLVRLTLLGVLLSMFIFHSSSASAACVPIASGTELGAQVNAAINALPLYADKNGQSWAIGCIAIPYSATPYSATTTININSPFVSLIADPGTVVYFNGFGDFIRIQQTQAVSGSHTDAPAQSTQIVNLNITNIKSSTGYSVGIHAGDMYGITLRNVSVSGFNNACSGTTPSAAIWFDNKLAFTEGLDLDHVNTYDNCIGIRFTVDGGTASFGYGEFRRVVLGLAPLTGTQSSLSEIGVSVESGAYLYHQNWELVTEANTSSAVGMKITPPVSGTGITTFGGNASQKGGDNWIDWRTECVGCGGAMTFLQMGGANTTFKAVGLISVLDGTATLNNASGSNFLFPDTTSTY